MSTPQIIGIIGEGKMGTNLFYYLLNSGFTLKWLVSPQADCERISSGFQKKLRRLHDNGIIDDISFSEKSRFSISNDPASLADCDLVIEAIPEDEEAKGSLFRNLDRFINPRCIFASNSSSIPPSQLIPSEGRKDKTVGLHFFYPISVKNIAELVITRDTSPETLQSCKEFLQKAGRFFLVQAEQSGFILNRIYLEFQLEAWKMVEEGIITIPEADQLVREHLFPAGVFDFFDSVGIDVILPSVKNYIRNYPDPGRFNTLLKRMESLVSRGELGVKTGKGFYTYPLPAEAPHLSSPPALQAEMALRLKDSLTRAMREFHKSENYPFEDLVFGMKEYLGASGDELF